MGCGPAQAVTVTRSMIPTSRCHDRWTTDVSKSDFFVFLHFSPFGVNVEIFPIAHSSLSPDRTGGRSIARTVRAHPFMYSPLRLGIEVVSIARIDRPPPTHQSILYPSLLGCVREGSHCAHASSAAPSFNSNSIPCARCASTGTSPTRNHLPSLPPCHLIPSFLQTSIDVIGVRVVGLRRTDGSRK